MREFQNFVANLRLGSLSSSSSTMFSTAGLKFWNDILPRGALGLGSPSIITNTHLRVSRPGAASIQWLSFNARSTSPSCFCSRASSLAFARCINFSPCNRPDSGSCCCFDVLLLLPSITRLHFLFRRVSGDKGDSPGGSGEGWGGAPTPKNSASLQALHWGGLFFFAAFWVRFFRTSAGACLQLRSVG